MANELIDPSTGEIIDVPSKLTAREQAIRAAAYVDTEGSFYIRKDGTAVITATNTDRRLTDWLRSNYGGNVLLQTRPLGSNQKPVWRWRVSSRLAMHFLVEIEPYLLLKTEHASVAIEAQMAAGLFDDNEPPIVFYRQKMQALNRRGVL